MPTHQNIKKITKRVAACSILVIFGINNSHSAGFDIITMKNGDIHSGTAAHESFNIKTSYGEISVPYISMQLLSIDGISGSDEIRTKSGDIFSGKIIDQEITALRQADPALPLAVIDIATVEFSTKEISLKTHHPPDAIETKSGDRFSGWIITSDYLLKDKESIHIINRKNIHTVDIEANPEQDGNRVQLTSLNQEIIQGQLLASSIKAKNMYGQTIEIPLAKLSTLAFGANRPGSKPDFHYKRNLNPAAVIQDRMADGTPGPELVILPGGEFQRGDLQGDGDSDERPPISIKLKPFAIGIYEITFDEYDLFCADTGRGMPDDQDWGRGRRPVINVSWVDAHSYTKWLSNKTGQHYRLPSDAEWEYATRAGTETRFWWGQEVERYRANCEGCGSIWDGEKSAPAGRFAPNQFGLHDTAGNLFEWVADCLHDDFSQDPTDGSAVDRPNCGKRIIRGGAWSFPPKEIRSANRWRDFPTRRSDDTGFRVARELE